MPRKARHNLNSNFFHIMVQGIEKNFIFCDPSWINLYLNLILKYSSKFDVNILSYCIMSNHAHLLIYVSNVDDMIVFFRCVNTSFAKIYNFKCNRVGYVFRNRYESKEVNSINQLIDTINYIHNNPVTANICGEASEYPYSSYSEFFSKSKIINKKILYNFFQKSDFEEIFK